MLHECCMTIKVFKNNFCYLKIDCTFVQENKNNPTMKRKRPTNITPVKVETAIAPTLKPKVVKLHNMRSGNTVEMSFKSATSLAKKFPQEYKLA